jgi:antitoxin component of RelBE/YafQ-DinJ toxin-antitoxin module
MPGPSRNVLLGVRVPPEVKDAAQKYADAQGITLAAAVNLLLRRSLAEILNGTQT